MKTVSFDIFDTCFSRTCGRPSMVFDIVGKKAVGDKATITDIADFRRIRIRGEKKARKISQNEDVTIKEIYEQCDFSGLTSLSSIELINIEIDVEKDVLKPIWSTLELVKKFHNSNVRIIYISDMYLPSSLIKELLVKYGFWGERDRLYVSSEVGLTKASGNLFRYIRNDLNIKSIWRHYGDNIHSDLFMPLRFGIGGTKVKYGYSLLQNKMVNLDFDPTTSIMKKVAGISHSLSISQPLTSRLLFATDIISPLYVSFTYNVLTDARRKGIKRLFFLARDGYVLFLISREMAKLFPDVETKYLYVSRKALYLAGLENTSREEIEKILPKGKTCSEEYFDNLQIDVEGLTYEDYHKKGMPSNLQEKLERQWREQKELVLKYFIQEGLADNKLSVGIVDIRGKRNSQRCINTILKKNNYHEVYGYYLEADTNRVIPQKPDEYKAWLMGDYHLGPNFKYMSGTGVLLEKYFCLSRAKRTAYYKEDSEGRICPVFEEGEYLPKLYEDIGNLNQKICINFCHAYIDNFLYEKSEDIFNYSMAIISFFSEKLPKQYLKALCFIKFNESSFKSTSIIKKLSFKNISKRDYVWFRGSLALTSPTLLKCYDGFVLLKKWLSQRI